MERTNELSQERIEEILEPLRFWRRAVYLPVVGSTNDVAKDMAMAGAPEGMVVVADEQTAGRGRLDRRWFAPPGACLLCSILFRPALPASQANRLTMLCSLAAAEAVEQVAQLQVAVKWPNDLVVEPRRSNLKARSWRKLAGVLTEAGMAGEGLDFVIVGIGINVNVPPQALSNLASNATSILAETDREVDRVALLTRLLGYVERRYGRLQAGESPCDDWVARLATLGREVKARTPDGLLTGMAESVDEDGALILRTPDGVRHRLGVGDVTLLRS